MKYTRPSRPHRHACIEHASLEENCRTCYKPASKLERVLCRECVRERVRRFFSNPYPASARCRVVVMR